MQSAGRGGSNAEYQTTAFLLPSREDRLGKPLLLEVLIPGTLPIPHGQRAGDLVCLGRFSRD